MSSFPLVSGDSFASACTTFPFDRPFSSTPRDDAPEVWFVEVADLAMSSHREWMLDRAARVAYRPTLVVHNGDLIPPPGFFADALEVFERVFSVNLVDESERLRAIPIGLENYWHRGAGELLEYLDDYVSLRGPDDNLRDRDRLVVASFRVATNPAVRGPLSMKLSARGLTNEVLSRTDYRRSLRQSMFVVSPPGNGLDCHRTWEAVYLGAVPVVLRSCIAPSLVQESPMMVVDEWEEVLDLSRAELEQRYVECRTTAVPGACLMPRWLNEIGVGRVAG